MNKSIKIALTAVVILIGLLGIMILNQINIGRKEVDKLKAESKEMGVMLGSRQDGMVSQIEALKDKVKQMESEQASNKSENTNNTVNAEEKFSLLLPVKNQEVLLYENYQANLKKAMRLTIVLSDTVKAENFRVFVSEDKEIVQLCFLSENGYFKPLYQYELMERSKYEKKYQEVLPEILVEKDGYYLTRKLLNLEVDDTMADDGKAAEMMEHLRKENSLKVELIY